MMNDRGSCEAHPFGEGPEGALQAYGAPLIAETFGGRIHVERDSEAAMTPHGQLVFFAEFLKTAGLWAPWVEECPLAYRSNNAPSKVDVLGTLMLSALAGHTRYAHIATVRCDEVNPGLLGMSKVVSEDSARRAFRASEPGACAQWQRAHLRRCIEELLDRPWVLDVDTSVKPLYGHQEGAVRGYNPAKPGRPSHVLHTYFVANTRMVLDVEVRAGNETAAKYTMPGLWACLDELPRGRWPSLLRADCAFGNDRDMGDAEERGLPYLFKLRQTQGVKTLIRHLFATNDWQPAGQGWQGAESRLRLQGWSRARRVIVLRRRLREGLVAAAPKQVEQSELAFADVCEQGAAYEYVVLVTSLPHDIPAIAQLYRDRSDCENIYDELKNQWGWGGYTTQDWRRSQVMARVVAQVYNWWSLYVGLLIPERHAEARTSRPLLLHAIGRRTRHAGQTRLTLASVHAGAEEAWGAIVHAHAFLAELRSTARQLSWRQLWRRILERVFARFLHNQAPRPPDLLPEPG